MHRDANAYMVPSTCEKLNGYECLNAKHMWDKRTLKLRQFLFCRQCCGQVYVFKFRVIDEIITTRTKNKATFGVYTWSNSVSITTLVTYEGN